MAKPDLASLPAHSSTRHPLASPSRSSNRVNRPPRSRSRYSSPSASALLALFATVSASPLVAHGYPLEPPQTALPFLYPPFLRQSPEKRSPTPSTSSPASSTTPTPTPPSSPSGCPPNGSGMPDNYILGSDGRWHKTDWSLYGSTYCAVSKNHTYVRTISMTSKSRPPLFSLQDPCPPPSSLPDTLQNDINNNNPPGSGSSPPPADFDLSTLPTGWNNTRTASTSSHGTVIILALSVALSVIIIVMMFSLAFWRRKHSPKRDPEKKGGVTPSIADDDNNRIVREAKARQRKWYKAASRWRENVRFSARRRRTNRVLASSSSYTTLSQDEKPAADTESATYRSRSRSSSPTATPRSVTPDVYTSSRASIRSSRSQTQTTHALRSQTPPIDPPPSTPLSPQPPAYHSRSSYPQPHDSPAFTYTDCSTSKTPLSLHTLPRPHDDDGDHVTPFSGHVATDDKAILSRRTALASAPPVSNSNISQSAFVPSMEDEDMFELPPGLPPSSPTHDTYDYEPQPPYSPPTSLLPPPPSKEKQRFDYSHDWDMSVDIDNATVEPQLGPSAPPFEESVVMPSAPPLDSDVHVPSAPPLDTEDDCPEATTECFQDDPHVDADTMQIIPQHVVPPGQASGG